MKRKLLLFLVALLGLGQAWATDALFFEDYDSSAKTVTLKYGEVPSSAAAVYNDENGFWGTAPFYDHSDEIKTNVTTITIDASCQSIPEMSLKNLFFGFSSLTTFNNLSNLKTALATSFEAMFCACNSLTSIDLSSFNTAHSYAMNSMFSGCTSLTTLNLTSFDTEDVTNMNSMFYGCTNLTNITFGTKFRATNAKNLSYMFMNCSKLTTINMSLFGASKVEYMSGMFRGCSSLTSLDLSSINTSNVKGSYMARIFDGCSSLTSITFGDYFTTAEITDIRYMFSGCSSLTSLDLRCFNTSKVTSMQGMFKGCSSLTTLDLSSFNTENVEVMVNLFYNCTSLKAIIVGNDWNVKKVHVYDDDEYWWNDENMFYNCTSLVGEDGTTVGSTVDYTYAHTNANGYLTKQYVEATTTLAGDAAWGTYYKSNVNRKADPSTTVYAAKKNGSSLTLVEVADRIIKAGEGVILKRAAAGTAQLKSTTEPATDSYYEGNALTGSDVAMDQVGGTTYYVLSYKDSTLGFYKYGSGNKLGANKAFMAVTGGGAPAYFDFTGNATGIEAVPTDVQTPKEVYDLQGRRVTAPAHGLYIVNGKKVFIP